MAGAHAAQVERMAQEKVVLLAAAHGVVSEVVQRFSTLDGKLGTRPRRKFRA
jgi:hypothetical protein